MTPENNDPRRDGAPAHGPDRTERFVFPKWTNWLREASAVAAIGGLVYAVVLIAGVFSPDMSAIGYAPEQPVPYSHALHAGELGIDCRYCHTSVETTAKGGPTTDPSAAEATTTERTDERRGEMVRAPRSTRR